MHKGSIADGVSNIDRAVTRILGIRATPIAKCFQRKESARDSPEVHLVREDRQASGYRFDQLEASKVITGIAR
jgi:hypothetical protein